MAKIPPPPPKAIKDPKFNRWLLEIQTILGATGGVDPTQIPGYSSLQTQANASTASIVTINSQITTINGQITSINTSITTINGEITTLQTQVAALQANPIIRNGTGVPAAGLGSNGDLYIDNNYPATNRLYAKIGGTWKSIV